MTNELLSLEGVYAGYRDSVVLHGVSLTLRRGEVVCLLGANGAGKSTTMKVLTGLIPPLRGQVQYDDRDLFALSPHERVDAGLVLSPEGCQVFPDMTVEENLFLGSYTPRARKDRKASLAHVYEVFSRLLERRTQKAGSLSGGEQQMLAIGRALMARPSLLLMDEPSLGLAPKIVQNVFDVIKNIAESGISILLVEQNTHAALSVATRGYLLSAGCIVHEGSASDLLASEVVRRTFMGSGERNTES